jgi:hypothetical protein
VAGAAGGTSPAATGKLASGLQLPAAKPPSGDAGRPPGLTAEVQWRFFLVAKGKHGVFLGKYFCVVRIAQA